VKRDMDLIREILLAVEGADAGASSPLRLELPEWDGHVVYQHARILNDAGYMHASFANGSPPGIHVLGLTWEGHDLIDSIRDNGVWSSVKAKVAEAGGSVPLEVLKAIAVMAIKKKLGMPDGG